MKMKDIIEWVGCILLAVLLSAIMMYFFKPLIVHQESMEPNFHSGDYIFASKQAYHFFGEPERGDVIVFQSSLIHEETGKPKILIKRIIGLPGDVVEIKDGEVYLNGDKIEEEFVAEQGMSGEMEASTVPDGKLFVMGDNRGVSADSRSPQIGMVDQDTVIGKVVLRIFPFKNISTF